MREFAIAASILVVGILVSVLLAWAGVPLLARAVICGIIGVAIGIELNARARRQQKREHP